jgi:uncharacterized protein (DUF2141 family)
MRRSRLAAPVLLTLLAIVAPRAQQPRDKQSPTATGQGRIAGIITDAKENRALRRARVSVSGSELTRSRTVITADDGTFAFDGLPGGRYSVSASKDGYVTMNYGAARPVRPGRVLTLAAGASIRADLRLPIGSVITGTVLTPDGEPAVGIAVNAYTSQYDGGRGERRFSLPPTGSVTTDDRGIYRMFGLAEGTYLVAAVPRFFGNADVQILTQAEIRGALADVRQAGFSTRPGMPAPPPRSNPGVVEGRRAVTLTPVFYPGTSLSERATPVVVHAGEVRNGVNFDLDYVPTSTVEGMVTIPQGMRVLLYIANTDPVVPGPGLRISSASDEGRFVFRSIPPGTYSISARAFPFNVRTDAQPAEISMWGETSVVVAGEDVTGIALALQPPLTFSGRLVFEGTGPRLPDLLSMRVPIPAFPAGISNPVGLPSAVVDGSRFSISGVLPGQYRFTSPPRGIRAPIGPWWMKSMILSGRELLDAPLELRESTDEGVITFSDKASELSGVVRATDGSLMTDGFVVVFAAEPRFWFHQSRRVAGLRLSSGGKYVVRNLPPGEYLVAVPNDIDFNEWFDPEALKVLARNAVRLSLKENEPRTLDLSPSR